MPETAAPFIALLDTHLVDLVFLVLALKSMRVMHEFIVRRIEAILDRPLIITSELVMLHCHAPAFLPFLGDFQQRRPLFLGQITEESKNDAVFFLKVVCIRLFQVL